MASITEDGTTFPAGVYELAVTDPVSGGPSGVANLPLKHLADRTAYLKIHVDALEALTARGPVYADVISLGADTTLTKATHMGRVIEGAACILTLPVNSGLEAGDVIVIKAGLQGCMVVPNSSQTIPDAALLIGTANQIALDMGEQVALVYKSGVWRMISYSQTKISSPARAVIAFAANAAPQGWLECDGSVKLRANYPRLFSVIGTTYGTTGSTDFKVPDLRGEFVRGWDHSRGVDSGRGIGTAQSDLFKAHTHTTADQVLIPVPTSSSSNPQLSTSGSGTNTGSTGGAETRPRNVAMMYCIKY